MTYIVNNATFETLADARAEAQRVANASGKAVKFATGWNTRTVVMPQTVPAAVASAPAVAPAAQSELERLIALVKAQNSAIDELSKRLEALETRKRARKA